MAVKNNLKKTQEYSESIIDTIREPLIILDQDLRVVTASRSFYEFFKVKSEQTVGQLIYDLGDKQWDIPKLRELLETILPQKTTFDNYEVEHDFAAIGRRVMLLNARQIKRALGKEWIILLAIEDITERKRLENILKESEERYRRLFETERHGIVFFEQREGKITDANPAIEKMSGYTKKEIIGSKLQDIGISLDMGDFQTTMQKLDKTGILYYDDVPAKTKSGQYIDTDIYLVDRATLVQCNIRDITERKHAEQKLLESEKYFKEITENSSDIIIITDKNGDIKYCSRSVERFIGYKPEELIGRSTFAFIYPDDVERAVDDFGKAVMAKDSAIPNALRIVRKDGSVGDFDGLGKNFLDNPTIAGFIINMRDITERKRTDEALRKTEETYRLVVDNMADVIAVIDLNLRFTYVSPSIIRLRGYTAEEAMEQTFEQVMTPESLQTIARVFEEELKLEAGGAADPNRIRILELEEYKKDGSTVWLENHLSFFRDNQNKPVGVISSSHDITERKQAEEALKESESKYRLLADNVNDVIFILDMNLKFTYVSPSTKILRGYEPEESVKLSLTETLAPSSMELAMKTISDIMELEKMKKIEINEFRTIPLEVMRKDGSTVWTEVKFTFIRDTNEQAVGILGVTRDITERKQAEEALRESEEQYRLVVENARESIIVTRDVDIKVVFANHSAIDTMGYSKEVLSSKYFTDLIHPDDLNMVVDHHIKRLKGEKVPPVYSFRVIRQDGTVIWCEINAALIQWKGKSATLLFLNNITERKQAEGELQQTLESLRKAIGATIQVMVSAVEMRDPYTAGHQLRAANLACAIAREMGLPQDKIEGLRMAGSIHDIGKLSIPAEILSKPTRLTNLEFSLIKEHSRIGYEMLKDVESPWPLAQIVYQHHERMDGSGYPRNLKGDEILMEARIMAVADVVESMASHRPYRAALGVEAALEEIEKNKGIFYDDVVADACLRLFREKGYKLIA
jgi:PAS domain S-box-containing protein